MIWYVTVSILIVLSLFAFAWKKHWLIKYKWLVLALVLLCGVSVYKGRWHYYYQPLAYNHLLTKSINNESKFKDAVNTYKRDNTGLFSSWHLIAHQKFKDKRADTRADLSKLQAFKAPHNLTHRQNKVKAQNATIRALHYQLKRYKNIR